ncbi:MAG: hypothetical protein DVB32_07355 [Verrucomicrobia bacterium]|nr:MAG: hypothetical protein DVB32_07355 [Verrucomicrobiota bacterium]
MKIELVTGQMWQVGSGFIRVVKVGKLLVEYKVMQDLDHKVAPLSLISQKEFCVLLKAKKASLLPPVVPGKPVGKKTAPAPAAKPVAKKAAPTPAAKPVAVKKTTLKRATPAKAKTSTTTKSTKPSKKPIVR